MKKVILSIAAIIMCSLYAHSQIALSFCTYVNAENQECIFDNTKFITSPDSTRARLFLMLHGNEVFGTTTLMYKAYAIDRFGKEVFLFDVNQTVEPVWMNAWQPVTFTTPGKYIVKVYKDPTHLMTSREFEFYNH